MPATAPRLAAALMAIILAALPAQAHYQSSNCSTSKLGGGTCQKHTHPHRSVPGSGLTNRAPAMGIDGSASTKAARIKVKQEESCGFLKALFVGC